MPLVAIAIIVMGLLGATAQWFLSVDRETVTYKDTTDTARAWLAYHNAEIGYALANTGTSGTLPAPSPALNGVSAPAAFTSCIASKILATWPAGIKVTAPGVLITEARAKFAGDTNFGIVTGGQVVTPDGRTVSMTCSIPNGQPVVFTQVFP